MVPVSVVIITKNVSDIMDACLQVAGEFTDDIIIIFNENGNEPGNTRLQNGCSLYKKLWDGYGANKNKGVEAARYDWILSIDADEVPDDKLIRALHYIKFENIETVYDIRFRSYFGNKLVRFGSWGRDHHIRLFNRTFVKWSETMVHETLILPAFIQKKRINGAIHHFSVKNMREFDAKGSYYARLNAEKYLRTGKKAGLLKLYVSPVFGFLKNYMFYLGFLDGREGWDIARTTFKNTYRKYQLLSQMETMASKLPANKDSLVVEY